MNTVLHGSESISYYGPKNREIVPVKINEFNPPSDFKKEIKNWIPQIALIGFGNNI